jgi:hypothetical protein
MKHTFPDTRREIARFALFCRLRIAGPEAMKARYAQLFPLKQA